MLSDLASIDYSRNITLSLYNEPFADQAFFLEAVKLVREKLPKAIIWTNSNGDYLTPSLLQKVALAGLNNLRVTIHPPKGRPFEPPRENRALELFLKKIGMLDTDNSSVASSREVCGRIGDFYLVVQIIDWQQEGNSRGGAANKVGNVLVERSYPCVKPFREFTVFHDLSVTQCCDAFYDP